MGELKIGRIVLGVNATNCYFVYREGEDKVLFFDPADEGELIYQKLKEKGFSVAAIILTHGHFDHIYGLKALKEKCSAKVYACESERELLADPQMNVSELFGRATIVEPDITFRNGELLEIAGVQTRVIATPGHTAGSCCFYFEEGGFLVCGDTLFQESTGRTDFPTGSTSQLVRSIQEKLFTLPGDTLVFPGHGGSTTIEHEKKYNPLVGEMAY